MRDAVDGWIGDGDNSVSSKFATVIPLKYLTYIRTRESDSLSGPWQVFSSLQP
jgi:hypothetical protein